MRTLILISYSFLILILCSYQVNKGYVIKGNLQEFPDSTKIYLQSIDNQTLIDSALVLDNHFYMSGFLEETPQMLSLNAVVNNQFIYKIILIGNEELTVEAKPQDFPHNVTITGSIFNNENEAFQNAVKETNLLIESLQIKRSKLANRYDAASELMEITNELRLLSRQRIDNMVNHFADFPDSYVTLRNLNFLKSYASRDTLKMILESMSDDKRKSKYARQAVLFLNNEILGIGDPYFSFEAENEQGDLLSLVEIQSDYILLNFHSAQCPFSLQSLNEIREIVQQHSDSICVISFSVDANKEIWLESVKNNNMEWVNLWDGHGRYSEPYIKYGIQGPPSFVLIGPDRTIRDVWAGYRKGSIKSKFN
jgi:hypothetical protein